MPSSKISGALRDKVANRAGRRCEYCFAPLDYSPDPFAVEHIVPRSRGGSSALENLALACFGCNNAKYNHISGFDAVTSQEVPLYNPRADNWAEHFQWNEAQVEARSATGRVTIEMLKLNRPPLINLRTLLASIGLHPPLLKNK